MPTNPKDSPIPLFVEILCSLSWVRKSVEQVRRTHVLGTEKTRRFVCSCIIFVFIHIKGSKERYLLGQKHNLQVFRVFPFVKLP